MRVDEGMENRNEKDFGETLREPANDDGAAAAPVEKQPAEPGPEERIAALEAENAELKDKLLRAVAEAENVRRRTQRDKDEAVRYASSGFAKDLLTVADNLRRALDSAPEEKVRDEVMRNLLTGVAATERELQAVLERHGIRRVSPKGERFDHNLHQAIFEAENTGQPPGTVVEVLQDGYVQHDRLLRPAMVGVAKGGPAAPSSPGERVDTIA
jgi:molecular chaperone GrpE